MKKQQPKADNDIILIINNAAATGSSILSPKVCFDVTFQKLCRITPKKVHEKS